MKLLSCLNLVKLSGHSKHSPKYLPFLVTKKSMADSPSSGLPLTEVVKFLTSFAPLSLAESWDNVGLLVEPVTPTPISKTLLTIDLTEDVVKEAVDLKANLIIAYHPPIFQPLKRITNNSWKERILATCLENRIAVFSPHTSWDAVSPKGLSDWLASAFEFEKLEPITPSAAELTNREFSHQVNILCPSQSLAKCKEVLHLNDTQIISEKNMELGVNFSVFAKKENLAELENGLSDVQSYHVAFERTAITSKGCGTGRYGKLKSPIKLVDAVNKVKGLVNMPQIRLAVQKGKNLDSTVRSVAVVAGSGASVLRGVRADLYVTGEMLHHDILHANHSGASVILINHSDSERGFLYAFAPQLVQHFGEKLSVVISKTDKDPIVIV